MMISYTPIDSSVVEAIEITHSAVYSEIDAAGRGSEDTRILQLVHRGVNEAVYGGLRVVAMAPGFPFQSPVLQVERRSLR